MSHSCKPTPDTSGFSSLTIGLHLTSLLLAYAYIRQQLTFNFMFVLFPSLLVMLAQAYQILSKTKGIIRAKYVISYSLIMIFAIVLTKVIKDQGGMTQTHEEQNKWLLRHRKCLGLLAMAMLTYIMYDLVNHQKNDSPSVVKEVLLSILSSLSTPLTICSGGACNSVYISTITSILSSFSIPLTLVVPILNVVGYVLQLVGLFSLYSTNKWRSMPFWLYLVSIVIQFFSFHQIVNWICCGGMILATVINAKTHRFTYGKKNSMFKQSIV